MSKYWTCCRKLEDEDAIQQYKTQWRRTINCWIHEYCRWCSKWVRKVKYFMLVPRILESYKLYDDVIQNILYLSGNIHRQQHVILKAIACFRTEEWHPVSESGHSNHLHYCVIQRWLDSYVWSLVIMYSENSQQMASSNDPLFLKILIMRKCLSQNTVENSSNGVSRCSFKSGTRFSPLRNRSTFCCYSKKHRNPCSYPCEQNLAVWCWHCVNISIHVCGLTRVLDTVR